MKNPFVRWTRACAISGSLLWVSISAHGTLVTTDLLTFLEIYCYDGITDTAAPGITSDTAAPGITYVRTASSVTLTHSNPTSGGAFYRFEAVLEP